MTSAALTAALRVILAPVLLAIAASPAREIIGRDLVAWERRRRQPRHLLLLAMPELRSVVYFRLASCGLAWKVVARALGLVYRPQTALYIDCPEVEAGLYFEHGFASIVTAERIGHDVWINQQVTIGRGPDGRAPTLEDGVYVRAGSVVIGGITLGTACHVGAGAVVTKNVPAETIVAGVPAKPIRATDRGYVPIAPRGPGHS